MPISTRSAPSIPTSAIIGRVARESTRSSLSSGRLVTRAVRALSRPLEAHERQFMATKMPIVDPLSGTTRPVRFGDIAILARDGIAFDLADGARLWLAPRRGLTMLVWAEGVQAHDTLLPNILMRGLNDAAPSIGGDISDLVPGH